ncbi:MAG: toll/interleukin-1 receptor domain-containing protein, partial [Aeromicrobium sp.]
MTHDVFICHSSKDRTIANAICSRLEQNHIRCWIAPRDVIPGSEYAQSIIEAISTARLTVLVFSDNSNHSPHIHREIERSVSHGIPILPFRLEDVVPSPALEYFISDAHWLDAMTPPLEQHLDQLVGTVQLLLDRESARDGTGPVSSPAAVSAATPTSQPASSLHTPIGPGNDGEGRHKPRTSV